MNKLLVIQEIQVEMKNTLQDLTEQEQEKAISRLQNLLKYWSNETKKETKTSSRFTHAVSTN